MPTIKFSPALNDYFAERIVREHGADEAIARTSGPMLEAVKRVIAREEQAADDHKQEQAMLHG